MESISSRIQQQMLSKIATSDGHGESSPYFDGWKAYDSDPYHPTNNPTGVIQMGLAENQLCFDLIEEWVISHPEASICTPEGARDLMRTAIFQDYHGLPEFTTAVARFMEKVRGDRVRFDPSRVVMSGGATGAHETLAFCLADPGDAFLVPTPYYPAYDRDLCWRTGLKLLPVVSDSSNGFKVTLEAMEDAYQKAQEANIRVKGFLLTNPSNPLGTVLDRETLKTIVSFINGKGIHLICDEIYSATVFSKPDFISISEIIEEDDVECNRNLIHIGYSLSKDLGFPGFRLGIVYSYNDAVVSCARKMSSFGLVSTQTQRLIAGLLADEDFVDKFLATSSTRLAERHGTFTQGLAQLEINTLKGNAGLYFWMDLKKLLRENTVEAEMELWRIIIHEVKLNVSPGSSFHCSENGWFRVCFANMDDETMRVALRRIQKFVILHSSTKLEASTTPKKSHCRNKQLKLSLSFRRLEDRMAMSPHSPMSSPLVRAT